MLTLWKNVIGRICITHISKLLMHILPYFQSYMFTASTNSFLPTATASSTAKKAVVFWPTATASATAKKAVVFWPTATASATA